MTGSALLDFERHSGEWWLAVKADVGVALRKVAVDEMIAVAGSLRSDTEQFIYQSILGDNVTLVHVSYLSFADHRKRFDATQCSMRCMERLKSEQVNADHLWKVLIIFKSRMVTKTNVRTVLIIALFGIVAGGLRYIAKSSHLIVTV